MLRLRDQVRSNETGITVFADDYNLSRSSEHINRAIEADQLLCSRYKVISRTDDLNHWLDYFSPVCECRDRLRASNAIELSYTKHGSGSQCLRCRLRRDHHHALHARNLRRDDCHEHRRGQRISSAGNITAHRVQRTKHLPNAHAGLLFFHPLRGLLPPAEAADVIRCLLERIAQLRRDATPSRLHLLCCDAHRLTFAETVPLLGVFAQRLITALPHIGDDLARDGLSLNSIDSPSIHDSSDDAAYLRGFYNFH